MEAKRQRRRDGRDTVRRRPPILTESEFLARRESVDRTMLVRENGDQTQLVVVEDGIAVATFNRPERMNTISRDMLDEISRLLLSMIVSDTAVGSLRFVPEPSQVEVRRSLRRPLRSVG